MAISAIHRSVARCCNVTSILGGILVLQIWVMSETLVLYKGSDFLVFI